MKEVAVENYIPIEARKQHIVKYPVFCLLPPESIHQLALLVEEVYVQPNEVIVNEGDYFDGFFLIVSGTASVSKSLRRIRKTNPRHIITLGPNNAIGLNDSGFHSPQGMRMASVIAKTDMVLLRVDILSFYNFLKAHQTLYPSLQKVSERFVFMNLVRHALSNLPTEKIKELIEKTQTHINPVANENTQQNQNVVFLQEQNKPNISRLEQVLFKQINAKNTLENILNSGLIELNNDEIYVIMVKLHHLGFRDFDLIASSVEPPSTPILKKFIKKITHFWKG
ncbi:cyclic nucleotide-binding domain-containing protein [Legionella lytica]|uniref:Cyclic nucleotide-binding domain-containing protein n=1 Tax=Legionella lytica TaxID=96232 RepID=A0ABY4Y730_9GAMM|nr:cyclic nucleotide-binding domain-containing protein [Legionella lytica]USQ13375.1 cyclic nucleotide-binding domain-containing protein [Legionella lytica]